MAVKKKKKTSQQTFNFRGLKHGYRSGLEEKTADQIKKAGLMVVYEQEKISYKVPQRIAKYTPDFILRKSDGSKMYIETKGLWTVKDRFKARLVHEEHDPLDLRYVFSNQNARLYKGSPTSYAMYCQRLGWKYAHKVIPEEWLAECVK